MYTIVVGLNYETAPVEIRERLAFSETDLAEASIALRHKKSVLENVIISTCNRTEVYAVVDQLHTGRYYVKEFLSEWFNIEMGEFTSYLFIYEEDEAIQHLFKLTSGLNSMVVGETQILGQVRNSFQLALESGATGTIFNEVFKRAVTVAKRAHAETGIGANAVSVSYAAVELSKKVFGDISDKRVLIVGAGKMGELAFRNMHGSGAKNVTVINRTFENAEALATMLGGNASQYEELESALAKTDILIVSTGSTEYVVTMEMMNAFNKRQDRHPIIMIDISVPRNIEPAISELESVFLYDIDDLSGIVEGNISERQKAAKKITSMIDMEINKFNEWVNVLGVVPVISALRENALAIQATTMESIERKMPDLTERERKVLNKHTKSIINQMLKEPILQAKEIAGERNAAKKLEMVKRIFKLEDIESEREKSQVEIKSNKEPFAAKVRTSFQP